MNLKHFLKENSWHIARYQWVGDTHFTLSPSSFFSRWTHLQSFHCPLHSHHSLSPFVFACSHTWRKSIVRCIFSWWSDSLTRTGSCRCCPLSCASPLWRHLNSSAASSDGLLSTVKVTDGKTVQGSIQNYSTSSAFFLLPHLYVEVLKNGEPHISSAQTYPGQPGNGGSWFSHITHWWFVTRAGSLGHPPASFVSFWTCFPQISTWHLWAANLTADSFPLGPRGSPTLKDVW